ncbi:MAG: methylmalonyl-CoA mutase small subunit [Bacteroidaceae bacterium]|nr:methylmalonyl-CoA mutase small subunit [Bacteroidaceae bacterium]
MANEKEKLFSEFPPVSTEEWMEKITVDLKGAEFEKKLVWKTNEGFKVQPFYRAEDINGLKSTEALPGEFPFIRGNKKYDNSWLVRQSIDVKDFAAANDKAVKLCLKGVDSFCFKVAGKDVCKANIETLLKGIDPQKTELNFCTCAKHAVELAQILVEIFKEKNCDAERVQGSINDDPINRILTKGKEPEAWVETAKQLVEICAAYPNFRPITVNALSVNNAGSYIYQELGYAIAWGNEYLNALVEAGVDVDAAAKAIKFNFGISSNYFMEIAKFRAARQIWAQVVKAYAPKCDCACMMIAHAETSSFNLTLFDSHVNLLRTQTESMSAAIAGIHSITVTPFDAAYAEPEEFSEHLARNQQLILKEECHLDKVVDPAAGSYYVETLTASIAKQATDLFKAVEAEGGMLAAVKAGTVQDAVNASNKARHEAAAKRRETLLGTNQFPNFTELSNGKTPIAKACCCGGSADSCEKPYKTLVMDREASEFEALRLQTENSGKRPKAFMLTIGNLAMRQARAQYSCNFLACAGWQVVDNLGFKTVEEGVDAALAAGADAVVICSSDDEYAEYAIPAYKYLNGRAMYIVAGNPACAEDLKAAGIENFIHVRVNVLDTLKDLNAKLGIK